MSSRLIPSLILGSASPRRKELLHQIGLTKFDIIVADIDEARHKNEKLSDLAVRLANQKAKAVFEKLADDYKGQYILAADTVVGKGRRLLDKAESDADVRSALEMMSGTRHVVYGGISLICPDGRQISRLSKTSVQFKRLSKQDIDQYCETKEGLGKAGGYAIQGRAATFVKSIQGSYSNIVGLSLYDTMQMLNGVHFRF